MTTTEDDLMAELRRFHDINHMPLQPGEFTNEMYAQATGMALDHVRNFLCRKVQSGEIIKVGERMVDGKNRVAFRLVTPA